MAEEQARLDKKNGVVAQLEQNGEQKKKKEKWYIKYLWTILLATALIVVLFFGVFGALLTNPSFADIGTLVRGHWFWFIVSWGILAVIIAINAKGKTASTLQTILCGVVVFALLIAWKNPGSNDQPEIPAQAGVSVQTSITLASMPVAEWPKLIIPAGGISRRIPLPLGMHHITVIGNVYRLHSVYQDGHECSSFGQETCPEGAVMEYFVTNEADKEEIISYAFVPK